ncbi:hypothetical protein C8R47DRAFT_290523 [Mycena vitilis]|nr:hypothetical protein C8R47DRAFT_290523 [Mycena vitilis]
MYKSGDSSHSIFPSCHSTFLTNISPFPTMLSRLLIFTSMAATVLTTPLRRGGLTCPHVNQAAVQLNFSTPFDPTPPCVYGSEAPCNYNINTGVPQDSTNPVDCPLAILNTAPTPQRCPFINGINNALRESGTGLVDDGRVICAYATLDPHLIENCSYTFEEKILIPDESNDNCLPKLTSLLDT